MEKRLGSAASSPTSGDLLIERHGRDPEVPWPSRRPRRATRRPRKPDRGSPPLGRDARDRAPSKLDTQMAPAPASMSRGDASMARRDRRGHAARAGASIRDTVAVLPLRTQTAAGVAAMAIGAGASEPGRPTIGMSSVMAPVLGSTRTRLGSLPAQRPDGAGARRDAVEGMSMASQTCNETSPRRSDRCG